MNGKPVADRESTADREFVTSRVIDAITFEAQGSRTVVGWRQVFDTAAERERIAEFVIEANEQNLDRLAAEVRNVA
jgi:hypothetical protein